MKVSGMSGSSETYGFLPRWRGMAVVALPLYRPPLSPCRLEQYGFLGWHLLKPRCAYRTLFRCLRLGESNSLQSRSPMEVEEAICPALYRCREANQEVEEICSLVEEHRSKEM